MTPVTSVPNATRQAPVSVARSISRGDALLHGHVESIGQDQPSFGIRIVDLDRLAIASREHVAQFIGIATDHVLHQAHIPDDGNGQLESSDGDDGAQHGRAPPMSHFMVFMASLGLSE